MGCYFTKSSLYRAVNEIREEFSLDSSEFKDDFVGACDRLDGLRVATIPFKTVGLRGMACFAKHSDEDDVILIDDNRSPEEQKFTCAHELFHLLFHRNEKQRSFRCYDKVRPGQDKFLEWHANEGAAELFVPYCDFIPAFCYELGRQMKNPEVFYPIRYTLAKKYGVTYRVIENRLDTLSYEIDQYRNGVSLDSLIILSKTKQDALHITPSNYNAICDFAFGSTAASGFY